MSTLKTLLAFSLVLSCVAAESVSSKTQGGPQPKKLTGPDILSTTAAKSALRRDGGMYTYTIDMGSPVAFDTVVYATDVTDAAEPIEYTVTIPAGSSTGTFDVVAVSSGVDTLIASNANGSASLDVTVL